MDIKLHWKINWVHLELTIYLNYCLISILKYGVYMCQYMMYAILGFDLWIYLFLSARTRYKSHTYRLYDSHLNDFNYNFRTLLNRNAINALLIVIFIRLKIYFDIYRDNYVQNIINSFTIKSSVVYNYSTI